MGISFQDRHPQDACAFCRPHNIIQDFIRTCPPSFWRAGTKDNGCCSNNALWGYRQKVIRFWCPSMLLRALSLSKGRSTTSGQMVAALKRDPHARQFTSAISFLKLFLGHNTRCCISLPCSLQFYLKLYFFSRPVQIGSRDRHLAKVGGFFQPVL